MRCFHRIMATNQESAEVSTTPSDRAQRNGVRVLRDLRPAVLRPADAAAFFAFSVATLWREVKNNPRFPKPLKLGPSRTGFLAVECERYLAELVAERDAATTGTAS